MSRSIAAICALRLLQQAGARGIVGLAASESAWASDPLETRIPYESLIVLWEQVMRASGDPSFPIATGAAAKPDEYDAVGFACMMQPTLREAIHQCVRYARVWTDVSEWAVESTDHTTAMVFMCPEPQRLGVRCATENVLAEMLAAGRVLTGVDYPVAAVRFRHAAPRDTSHHERFFRGPIVWGAPRNEIVVSREHADLPLPKADPAIAAFFDRHIRQVIDRQIADTDRITPRVRAFLIDEIRRGAPSLEAAATKLGTSSRTLKRRLQEEGTSYQDLADAVRCDLAKRYLEETRLSLGEVAFLLGFSEPSAFHRAFKRWTGRTPLAHRQAPSAA